MWCFNRNDNFVFLACLVSVMTFEGLQIHPGNYTKMMLEQCCRMQERNRQCQLVWKPLDYGEGIRGVKELIYIVQASQKSCIVCMLKKRTLRIMVCCPQITVLLTLSGVSVCCQRNKTAPSLDIAFEIQYLKRITCCHDFYQYL